MVRRSNRQLERTCFAWGCRDNGRLGGVNDAYQGLQPQEVTTLQRVSQTRRFAPPLSFRYLLHHFGIFQLPSSCLPPFDIFFGCFAPHFFTTPLVPIYRSTPSIGCAFLLEE